MPYQNIISAFVTSGKMNSCQCVICGRGGDAAVEWMRPWSDAAVEVMRPWR